MIAPALLVGQKAIPISSAPFEQKAKRDSAPGLLSNGRFAKHRKSPIGKLQPVVFAAWKYRLAAKSEDGQRSPVPSESATKVELSLDAKMIRRAGDYAIQPIRFQGFQRLDRMNVNDCFRFFEAPFHISFSLLKGLGPITRTRSAGLLFRTLCSQLSIRRTPSTSRTSAK